MQFLKSPKVIHRFFWFVFALNIILYAVLAGVVLWNPSPAEAGADLLLYFFVLPSIVLFLVSLLVFLILSFRSKTVYLFEVLILLTSPPIFVFFYLLLDRIAYYRLRSSQQEYEVFEEVNEDEVAEIEEMISTETPTEIGEPPLEVESTDMEVESESYNELQLTEGEELISPYIIRKITCDTELCWSRTIVFLDLQGNVYPVPAGTVNNAGDGWVYMDSANQIFTYDVFTGESQLLMSVLDTTQGVSFEWSPNDSKLAIVVVNPGEDSYLETYGSKLFMFSFDAEGKMLQKDRYLFKIKYGCHDAGCDSTAGEDFYFVDNDTFVYYTWEGDPYVERTEEFKRTVEL